MNILVVHICGRGQYRLQQHVLHLQAAEVQALLQKLLAVHGSLGPAGEQATPEQPLDWLSYNRI